MSIPALIAYTNHWSIRAGGRIEVKVSCNSAIIVRTWSAFAAPIPIQPALACCSMMCRRTLKEAMRGDHRRSIAVRMEITSCGSLPWNNFDNQISVLLRNVVTRFMAE
jgi:hypothetical protein